MLNKLSSPILNNFNRWLTVLLFFIIIITASFYYFYNFKNQNFFIDEHEFLRKSYYFDLLFIKHNLNDKRWYFIDSEIDAAQPKVGPYIYGLALHLAGINNIEQSLNMIGFNTIHTSGNEWWLSLWGHSPLNFPPILHPSLEILWVGRITGILFTICTIGIFFIVSSKIYGNLFGVIASCLLMFNRLLSSEGQLSDTDSMQLFFFYLNILLIYYWVSISNSKKQYFLIPISIAIGMTAAFGLGVKVTALMLVLFIYLIILLSIAIKKKNSQSINKIIISACIIGISFSIIFYLLHPFIYNKTLQNVWFMFHNRFEGSQVYYQSEFPETAIKTRSTALWLIFNRTLAPQGAFSNFQIPFVPIDFILFTIGMILMFKKAIQTIFTFKKPSKFLLFPVWIILELCCLCIYLMNDWSRYYLPFVTGVVLAEAYTITILIEKISKQVYKN